WQERRSPGVVPGFDHFSLPTRPDQHVGTVAFDTPLFDAAVIILHIQENEHVRIGPFHIGYDALHVDRMLHVVRRARMVSQERPRNHKRAYDENERNDESVFHGNTLRFGDRSSPVWML